jgi:hypothetical protein
MTLNAESSLKTDANTVAGSLASSYTVTQGRIDIYAAHMLALWRSGLTHSGNPQAKLDWYYTRNVQGLPTVFFLNHTDSRLPVGVAAIGQRDMRLNGETIRAGALVDFVTTSEHRTLFPALLLQKELRQQGLATHQVLYGLPNTKSLAVVRRAGYSPVGQMVRYARVLRSAAFVARHLPEWLSKTAGPVIDTCRQLLLLASLLTQPKYRTSWLESPDVRFDTLWENLQMKDVLIGRRDRAFLAWRFKDNRTHKHAIFTISAPDTKQLVAYAVCEEDATTLHVRDFLADPNIPNSMNSLWAHLISNAYGRGLSTISVEFLGNRDITHTIQAAGFKPREKQPMYAATNADWQALLNENMWFLTSADKD